LSEQTQIPWPTVIKLLKLLGKSGLVHATQGRRGGYALAHAPTHISVTDVIEAIEGPVGLTECTREDGECGIRDACCVKAHWTVISAAVRISLDNVSLESLAEAPPSTDRKRKAWTVKNAAKLPRNRIGEAS
jgi:Rrf2 family protein